MSGFTAIIRTDLPDKSFFTNEEFYGIPPQLEQKEEFEQFAQMTSNNIVDEVVAIIDDNGNVIWETDDE